MNVKFVTSWVPDLHKNLAFHCRVFFRRPGPRLFTKGLAPQGKLSLGHPLVNISHLPSTITYQMRRGGSRLFTNLVPQIRGCFQTIMVFTNTWGPVLMPWYTNSVSWFSTSSQLASSRSTCFKSIVCDLVSRLPIKLLCTPWTDRCPIHPCLGQVHNRTQRWQGPWETQRGRVIFFG